jgi:phage baseplate assembly protein W
MATYQLKLPIAKASEYGLQHIQSVQSSIWQDLKSLMLTIPGEKINDPDFGVGLQRYIFEQNSEALKQELRIVIGQKVARYMPFINIENILFTEQENTLLLTIDYYIGSSVNIQQISLALNSASK